MRSAWAWVALTLAAAPAPAAEPEGGLARALSRQAVEELVAATGILVTAEARLDEVARRLCVQPAPVGSQGADFARVRLALWEAGVGDYAFTWRLMRFRGSPRPAALLRGLGEGVGDARYTHLGVGVFPDAGAGGCAALILVRRIAFPAEPLPGRPTGEGARLAFRLAREYVAPRVLVTTPDGRVLSGRVAEEDGIWVARYPLDPPGAPHRVEVVAQGPAGTEIAMLFPVGGPGPAEAAGASGLPGADLPAEARLVAWINAERRAAGLPELEVDRRLAEIARRHSEAMRRGGFFGHAPPDGETLVDRLSREGLLYSLATENIARAESPAVAHACLMASPGHRANVLDPRVTHVGVGVVEERGAVYVTENFARLLPPGDALALREEVVARIDALRARAGLPGFRERRVLSGLAQELAERAARDGRALLPPPEGGDLGERVRFMLPRAGRVAADLIVADGLGALDSSGHLGDPRLRLLGVGVARGAGPADRDGRRVGEGMLWVVLVMAEEG